jgi:simple sugar transport system permease protein
LFPEVGFKLEKRSGIPTSVTFVVSLIAILVTFVVAGVLFWFLGFNPLTVYERLLLGALGSTSAFYQTVTKTIPLLLVSVGLAVAFKAKVWNIGGPGQMVVGSIAATWRGRSCAVSSTTSGAPRSSGVR